MTPRARRLPHRIRTLPKRGALGLLVLTAGFVSGFGASDVGGVESTRTSDVSAFDAGPPAVAAGEAADPEDPAASWSRDGLASEMELATANLGAAANSVVAEYAPVSVESLPRYQPEEEEGGDAFGSGSALTIVTKGRIEPGRSLSSALRAQGIPSSIIHLIAREMKPVFDFRHSRAGDRYRLGQDPDGNVLDFRYATSPEKSFYLFWEGTRYVVREERAELRAQLSKVGGVVESSLYLAIRQLGEGTALANEFADVFAWDIDFSRNARPGDDFQILYERLYRTDDEGRQVYVKPGRILAAHYRGAQGEYSVLYYEPEPGRGGYYRPDGTSVERAFLVAPLEFSRISSTFSKARRHPILKVVRPHRGIDYAAAKGAPLWSVADGTVIYRGWAGASGNLVKVRHVNGYISYYAHLSRFADDLKLGQRVSQREVIGYVGDTGLATGPHVCFRVQKNGKYVNPLDIVSPPAESISGAEWARFSAQRDFLLSDLGTRTIVAADEAL